MRPLGARADPLQLSQMQRCDAAGPVGLDDYKQRQRKLWGSAPWERLAATLGDVYADLVRALAPSPAARWLDLATGTGGVAIAAARAGADVTAQDLAPGMLNTARRLALDAGVQVRFELGDVEALAYPEASFDLVSSAFGVTFARDHAAVARELARVCRPGGMIGLVDWQIREHRAFETMLAEFIPAQPASERSHDWGDEHQMGALLGGAFELEFIAGESPWRGGSGEAIWRDYVEGNGQARAWVAGLAPQRRDALHRAWVSYFERHREPDGIRAPREYLLVRGRRRARSG